MKIIKFILKLAVLLLVLFLLIASNPSKEQFIDWIITRANQDSDSALKTFLNETITGPVLSLATTRKDYIFFSSFVIEGLERESRYLGLGSQFIPLDGLQEVVNRFRK